MAVVGLVPFGCALVPLHKATIVYWALFLGAAAYHAMALRWMGAVFFGMLEDVWLFSILLAAFCWVAGFGLGRAAFLRRSWPMAVVLPAVWLVCEYLRHLAFGLVDGNGMPLVWFGQALADFLPLMQCADLAGVFAPTWLLASASGALFDLSAFGASPSRRGAVRAAKSVAIAGSVLLLAWGYGLWRMGYSPILEGPKMALLTGEVQDDWQLIARNAATVVPSHAAVSDASSRDVDLAAWPEMAHAGVVLTRGRKGVLETEDSSGRVLESAEARPGAPIVLIGSAPLDGRGTVYAICGDWLPITWLIFVVSAALLRWWSQRKRRSLTPVLEGE